MADAFVPGSNRVVSQFAITAGSLDLGGNIFAFGGNFTTVATNVVYDATSAAYGNETGYGTNIDIHGTGAGGDISIRSLFSGPLTMNLAPLWGASLPASIDFTLPLDGTIDINGVSKFFSESFVDIDTFFFDGTDTVTGNISLTTDIGNFTGTMTAVADPQIVPEPSTLGLAIISLVACIVMSNRYRT